MSYIRNIHEKFIEYVQHASHCSRLWGHMEQKRQNILPFWSSHSSLGRTQGRENINQEAQVVKTKCESDGSLFWTRKMRSTLKQYFSPCDHEPNAQNHLGHLFTIHIPRPLLGTHFLRVGPRDMHF